MNRKETLLKAMQCVCQERNSQYGEPEDVFRDIAMMWSVYLGTRIRADEVAMMMALLKIVRSKANPDFEDNFIDLAGYAACASEVVKER